MVHSALQHGHGAHCCQQLRLHAVHLRPRRFRRADPVLSAGGAPVTETMAWSRSTGRPRRSRCPRLAASDGFPGPRRGALSADAGAARPRRRTPRPRSRDLVALVAALANNMPKGSVAPCSRDPGFRRPGSPVATMPPGRSSELAPCDLRAEPAGGGALSSGISGGRGVGPTDPSQTITTLEDYPSGRPGGAGTRRRHRRAAAARGGPGFVAELLLSSNPWRGSRRETSVALAGSVPRPGSAPPVAAHVLTPTSWPASSTRC